MADAPLPGFRSIDPYAEPFLREPEDLESRGPVSVFVPEAGSGHAAVIEEAGRQGFAPARASCLPAFADLHPDLVRFAVLEPVFEHDEYGPLILMSLPDGDGRRLSFEPLPERWSPGMPVLVRPRTGPRE